MWETICISINDNRWILRWVLELDGDELWDWVILITLSILQLLILKVILGLLLILIVGPKVPAQACISAGFGAPCMF